MAMAHPARATCGPSIAAEEPIGRRVQNRTPTLMSEARPAKPELSKLIECLRFALTFR
jgi:hypothetical protein